MLLDIARVRFNRVAVLFLPLVGFGGADGGSQGGLAHRPSIEAERLGFEQQGARAPPAQVSAPVLDSWKSLAVTAPAVASVKAARRWYRGTFVPSFHLYTVIVWTPQRLARVAAEVPVVESQSASFMEGC